MVSRRWEDVKHPLQGRMIEQIESYLMRDPSAVYSMDTDCYVPLTVIAGLRNMRSLTQDISYIRQTMQMYAMLSVQSRTLEYDVVADKVRLHPKYMERDTRPMVNQLGGRGNMAVPINIGGGNADHVGSLGSGNGYSNSPQNYAISGTSPQYYPHSSPGNNSLGSSPPAFGPNAGHNGQNSGGFTVGSAGSDSYGFSPFSDLPPTSSSMVLMLRNLCSDAAEHEVKAMFHVHEPIKEIVNCTGHSWLVTFTNDDAAREGFKNSKERNFAGVSSKLVIERNLPHFAIKRLRAVRLKALEEQQAAAAAAESKVEKPAIYASGAFRASGSISGSPSQAITFESDSNKALDEPPQGSSNDRATAFKTAFRGPGRAGATRTDMSPEMDQQAWNSMVSERGKYKNATKFAGMMAIEKVLDPPSDKVTQGWSAGRGKPFGKTSSSPTSNAI